MLGLFTSSTPDGSVDMSTAVVEQGLLQREVQELQLLLTKAGARVSKLEAELDDARGQVAWLARQLFGRKAEKVSPVDVERAWLEYHRECEAKACGMELTKREEISSVAFQLLFEPLAQVEAPVAAANAASEPSPHPPAPPPPSPPEPPPKNRDNHGRKTIPEELTTVLIPIDLDPEELQDGQTRRCVGVEISYRLGIRKAEFVRLAIARRKYAVDNEDAVETRFVVAEPPAEMTPGGLLAPSALSYVISAKWEHHVPWNRLGSFFEGHGYRLSVSTLSGATVRAAPLATDLKEAMVEYARVFGEYIAIDASSINMRSAKEYYRGHVWVREVPEIGVFVDFTKKHDGEVVAKLLGNWTCPVVADGANVYDATLAETGSARGGCFSHARRKFVYAADSDDRGLVAVRLIDDLFAVERELKAAHPEERRAVRLLRARPILEQLLAWRDGLLGSNSVSPKSTLAKALRYLRNQEARLSHFLLDGRIPIHNNAVETRIRHLAVGRKNWLFLGSDAAAKAASTWLTLILSAKGRGLEPGPYLRDLFRVLPVWPKSRILELAPHNWAATRARLRPDQLAQELGPVDIPPLLTG